MSAVATGRDSAAAEGRQRAVAVVLAAGVGRRFGGTKPAAELGGRPLVVHVVEAARAAGVGHVVVVVGHDRNTVAATLSGIPDIEVVDNPRHRAGQATSVTAGLRAAQRDPHAGVAVMLLADQPRVRREVIGQVIDRVLAGAVAARARYDDGDGHPVAFARAVWPQLIERLRGDEGARQLFGRMEVTAVATSGQAPVDVDARSDLERLEGPHRPR